MTKAKKVRTGPVACANGERRFSGRVLSFMERRNKAILLTLIPLVVLSGTAYCIRLGGNLRYADEKQYCSLAENIVEHHRYSYDGTKPTAYRPPGYPALLSLFVLLGAGTVHLRIVNFVAIGLTVYLLNRILTEQSSRLAGTIGVLLVVCYPVLFYTAGTLYPQTIGSLLLLVVVYLLTRKTRSYWPFVAGGMVYGYLVLTIPIFLLMLPLVGVWLYFSERPVAIRRVLATVTVACLPICIWSARNYAAFDAFVLVSSNSGRNLFLGNSENTTPNTGVNVDTSEYDAEAESLNLDEIGQDKYWKSKAIEFVRDNKIKAAKLYLLKTLNYFNYSNRLATKGETSAAKDLLMLATYGPLVLLFLWRIILLRRFRPSRFEILLIALYFSSALFYAIFFTRIRFRLPFDYLLISVVAMFLAGSMQRRVTKHSESRAMVEVIRKPQSGRRSGASINSRPVVEQYPTVT